MLALTDEAITAIKELAPGDAGLRVFMADVPGVAGQQAFQVELADEPAPGDDTMDVGGAHLFLQPEASTLLDDKVLDATVHGTTVRFAVGHRS